MFLDLFAIVGFHAVMVVAEGVVTVFAGERHPVDLSALFDVTVFSRLMVLHNFWFCFVYRRGN